MDILFTGIFIFLAGLVVWRLTALQEANNDYIDRLMELNHIIKKLNRRTDGNE